MSRVIKGKWLMTFFSAIILLFGNSGKAHAQFAVIDAQNAVNQIMSYIQDGENALLNIQGIAEVFTSLENVHGALQEMQKVYNEVSPIIRDTKAVADIAVNYARVVEDWDRYCKYMQGLEDPTYSEIKYTYYWGTRLVKNAAEDFEYARKLISSRSLNMDDYQRYSQLQQLSQRLANIHRTFSTNLNQKQKQQEHVKSAVEVRKSVRQFMR